MVKRLYVFLFIFSLGCSFLAGPQAGFAQSEPIQKNSLREKVASPLRSNQEQEKPEVEKKSAAQDSAKKVSAKKDAAAQQAGDTLKQEKAKSDPQEKAKSESSGKKTDSKQAVSDEKSTQDSKKDSKSKDSKSKDSKSKDSKSKDSKAAEKPSDKQEVAAAEAKISSEHLLPPWTKLWVSIPDSKKLAEQIEATQIGELAKNEAIKPFIESFRKQVKDWLNGQNVRLGLTVDDLNEVQTGEICIAGVLPELDGKQPANTAHGLVLLVDVSKTKPEAQKLLDKINKLLVERGAKQEDLEMNQVKYRKSTIKNENRLRATQNNFQAIVNGWMLVSDNELIFRDVLRRLAAPQRIKQTETLSVQPAFVEVMKQTNLGDATPHVRWFVDPFGYLQLAQAIEEQDRTNRVARNDWAGKLRENGFDAFQGVGGNVSIATAYHEVLHRTFIFAPHDPNPQAKHTIFDLFDFRSQGRPALEPASWVPVDCAGYFVANWNMSRALDGAGVIYDALIGDGEFEKTLKGLRNDDDIPFDARKVVGLMDDRITVVAAVQRPITEESECVCIGIPIKGEGQFIYDSLKRASRGQEISLGGIKVIKKVDTTVIEPGDEDIDIYDLPGADEEEEEDEEEEREFELFKQRFMVVHDGHLLIANNKTFLRRLLEQDKSKLAECADYIQVKDAIAKLSDGSKISFRQFGRIDQVLETNYEMLRRGEMGKAQTVLARIMNQSFAKQAAEKAAAEGTKVDPNAIREQKLDGSKLPANYAKVIAPYFGPAGWVMETEAVGWRISGCVLKKKQMTEVVQKIDEEKKSQR